MTQVKIESLALVSLSFSSIWDEVKIKEKEKKDKVICDENMVKFTRDSWSMNGQN